MKKLFLIIALLISSVLCSGQSKLPNTVLTVGHSFKNDISFSVGGRFSKGIYATYEFNHNCKSDLQASYVGIGLGSDKSIALFKFGAKTEPYESTHINYTDYGIEYLWIDKYMERQICYGLTVTKRNGVGFKIGLVF